jgi:hypothetical protein
MVVGLSCAEGGIDPNLTPADLNLPHRSEPEVVVLPEGLTVRAATFNLHGGSEATAQQLGTFLAGLSLDVVALQETPRALGVEIAAVAGFSAVEGDGQLLLAKAPLWAFERIEVLTRSFVRARLMHQGVEFSVYSAHLGWNAEGDVQCRLFRQHLDADPVPYQLVLGDFNDEHGSTQIGILDEAYQEASEKVGLYPGQRISWPATGFDGGEGSQLIDLIFFPRSLGVIVKEHQVLNTRPVLSDHKPVWVELLYPPVGQTFMADPYAAQRQRQSPITGPNLLSNPGAEEGLVGWTVKGDARAEADREEQRPFEGQRFFTGAPNLPADALPVSSIAQEVDLSSYAAAIDAKGAYLVAAGVLTTGYSLDIDGEIRSNRVRPYDDGELIFEVLDPNGAVLARQSSARRDTLSYRKYEGLLPIPVGARRARLRFLSHRKANNGQSNDAIADALSLAVATELAPHLRLFGNRISEGDAEHLEPRGEGPGFRAHPDLTALGVMIFPPWAYSGEGHFVAGEPLGQVPTPGARLERSIDLSGLEAWLDADELALRFGGYGRTFRAESELRIQLEIFDADGEIWGAIPLAPVWEPEWTHFEGLVKIPKGTSGARLVVEADVPEGEWVFVDELYAYPELRPTPP